MTAPRARSPGPAPVRDAGQGGAGLDVAVTVFTEVRARLFGIGYRMLGSVVEAEDVLQETWIRWHTTDRSVVRNPHAFLTTTTTRLAINVLQSGRTRHETCAGPWLAALVDMSHGASGHSTNGHGASGYGVNGHSPALGVEQAADLEVAVLVLLERLTPTERAAYVLREAFDYAYADIANIVQLSQAAARQLVSRARKHIDSGRRSTVLAAQRRALLEAFVAAARSGDLARLERLFVEDVAGRADSVGRADVAVRPAEVRVAPREATPPGRTGCRPASSGPASR
ncbi:sigma factor-like helix-turn-helix DNA-binding protein [Promicromonospora sukumoe]|uniref:sigma factor-like helix-turn-helix DNA-binding protein n=1 Tax=Promicromonospora sukumoe TaxID=88382 RepID=UPI003656723B